MNKLGVREAMLVISLSPFLLSCEKDALRHGSGEKVTINFTVSNGNYDADQQITRSEKRKDLKAETVHIPLNDDYFLAATLTPEPAAEVRAAAEFAIGQKIYFAVYSGGGTTPDDEAIYTWNGSKFIPDGDPLGVEPDGTPYHFVAYSFFGDPEEEPYVEDIEPWQDLVWGEKDQPVSGEASRTVSIVMKHKFSRVRVQVDASTIDAQVTAVSGVVIAGGKEDVTIVAKTGLVDSYGNDATETFGSWTSENGGKARRSEYKMFCPQLTTVTLDEIDLEIDENPMVLEDRVITFTRTLSPNTSYTVMIDIRENRWAHSNIYWDDALNSGAGGLTFDKKRTNPYHADYQGVFFKWGSLVGISPVGDNTNAGLFIPDNIASRTWDATKNLGSMDTPWGSSGLENVPSLAGTSPGSEDFAIFRVNYLYNLSNSTAYADFTGDVCRYIGGDDWRLPNMGGDLIYIYSAGFVSGIPFPVGTDPSDASGRGSMGSTTGATYSAWGSVFFPASGFRGGILENVGSQAYYFVGNEDNIAGHIPLLNASSSGMYWVSHGDVMALSVRCIKKLPTD